MAGAVSRALLLCVGLNLVLASAAMALPPPKVSTELESSFILVEIKIPSVQKASKVILRRFNPDGQMSVYTFTKPKKVNQLFDDATAPGNYRYRARLINKKLKSNWSKERAVTIPAAPIEDDAPISNEPSNPLPPITLAPGLTECPSNFTTDLVALVNAERALSGAAALTLNSQLGWSAQTHSAMMGASNTLTHSGWYEEILASGYSGTSFGQNVAHWYAGASQVMAGWLASPGHRANILKPTFREIGIGCVLDGSGSAWWTQNFGG
jgi:uncharacterized protein YkwD